MADNRTDSAHVAAEIFSSAMRKIPVPDCVNVPEAALPYWEIITRARAEWTDIDLIHAANLARCMLSIEENQEKLSQEGDIVKNDRGTLHMNPRFSILEQLSRRSVTLSAKIHVHAAATQGEAKLQRGKNTVKRKAVEVMKNTDDNLIARPN